MTQAKKRGRRGQAAAAWRRCLAAWLCLAAASALAQDGRVFRIGVTKIVGHEALDADERGFVDALAGAGFKEGVNLVLERRNAEGDLARAAAIAQDFVDLKMDLVHAIATPTAQAMVKASRRLPIIFSSITDPVGAGIVPRDSAPGRKTGTNVTGVSDMWPVELQFETYAKFVPKATVWGTIYNPAEQNSVIHVEAMRAAARRLGFTLVEATIANAGEVDKAVTALAGRVQAINITSDNTAVSRFDTIARICDERRIPLFSGDVDSVASGAVAAYGLDYYLVGYAAGKKAALVLKGMKPADIPWGPVEKFSLVINEKAAKAQGVAIAPELLKMADKVIR